MARGSKKKYTSKQKRKASKIERGYKNAALAAGRQSVAHGQR